MKKKRPENSKMSFKTVGVVLVSLVLTLTLFDTLFQFSYS